MIVDTLAGVAFNDTAFTTVYNLTAVDSFIYSVVLRFNTNKVLLRVTINGDTWTADLESLHPLVSELEEGSPVFLREPDLNVWVVGSLVPFLIDPPFTVAVKSADAGSKRFLQGIANRSRR